MFVLMVVYFINDVIRLDIFGYIRHAFTLRIVEVINEELGELWPT
jgi:hypothetical protein